MARLFHAEIGTWYDGLEGPFKVVAIDEDALSIEVQYFDGTVSEMDMEGWYTMVTGPIAAPEDWSGPFDDLERADLDEADIAAFPHGHQGVLDEFEWFK